VKGCKRGFTLIELMVAVALSLVIIITAFTAFNTMSRAMRGADNKVKNSQDARAILGLMERELSAAITDDAFNAYFRAPDVSPNMEIRFVCTSTMKTTQSGTDYDGILEVRYFFDAAAKTLSRASRVNTVFDITNDTYDRSDTLLENLAAMGASYYDPTADQWKIDWEISGAPSAIKITMIFQDKEDSKIVQDERDRQLERFEYLIHLRVR